MIQRHDVVRKRHGRADGGANPDVQTVVRLINWGPPVSNYELVHTELSALATLQTRAWTFVRPATVSAGFSPLRATVDVEPPNLVPGVSVGHCPFLCKT